MPKLPSKPKHGFKKAKGWQLRIFEICDRIVEGVGWFWLAFSLFLIGYGIVMSFFWGPAVLFTIPMAIVLMLMLSSDQLGYLKRRWKANRIAKSVEGKTLPPHLKAILEGEVKIFHRLPEKLRPRLEQKMMQFLATILFKTKGTIEGGLSDRVRVCVAAEACLLVLHRDFAGYRWLKEVEICDRIEGASGQANRESVSMEWDAVQRGLADCTDGQSVTLHEFAHVLDKADDNRAQSIPVPKDSPEYRRWEELLDREFDRLWEAHESGEASVIDSYALKVEHEYVGPEWGNPMIRPEFFPCATEAFFERSKQLRDQCPKIYQLMKEFYRLDPTEWPSPKLT